MPSFREQLRRLLCDVDHLAVRDDRDVVALALHLRLAERDGVVAFGHLALGVVEHLALEHHHRIVVADRALEEPLRIVGRAGRDEP